MRTLMLFFTFIYCSFNIAASNPKPTNPYTMAGISEVYIASSAEWYIELNGAYCLYEYSDTEFPCSVSVYLRIGSATTASKGIFRAKVGFAKNQYGVLSQKSLVGLPQGRVINLASRDTVMVTRDTVRQKHYWDESDSVEYWKFPLRPVTSGHVLVAVSYSQILESSRKSLGSAGNYQTLYRIVIVDAHGKPVENISLQKGHLENYSVGIYSFVTSLDRQEQIILFNDSYSLNSTSTGVFLPCSLKYREKDTVVNDTQRVDATRFNLIIESPEHLPITNIGCYTSWLSIQGDTTRLQYRKRISVFGNNSNSWLFRVYKSHPVDTVCICNKFPVANTDCIEKWVARFVDTTDVINDTLRIQPTAVYSQNDNSVRSSGIKCSFFNTDRRNLYIVVSSPLQAVNGYISLYNISGREAGNVPFEIKGPGTSTISLDLSGRPLVSGTYLCRIAINGYSSISHQVFIK